MAWILRDCVTVCVECLSFGALLRRLHAGKMACFFVEIRGKRLNFVVSRANLGKVVAIAEELGYNYEIKRSGGLASLAAHPLRRIGLLFGVILCVVALLLASGFVSTINVNLSYRRAEVVRVLGELGVSEGTYASELDCDALGQALFALDGVAFASVVRHGNVLYVTLQEEAPSATYEYLSDGAVLTATKGGVVARILVFEGTACVKIGDEVKQGDVLVEGYNLAHDERVPCAANGEVFGRITYSAQVTFGSDGMSEHYRVLAAEQVRRQVPTNATLLENYYDEIQEGDTTTVTATIVTLEKLTE